MDYQSRAFKINCFMEFEGIDILTALKISEFESNVALTSSSKTDYTNIERSEAFETLGIAQFYNGDYSDAVLNLEKAISNRFINLKSKRRLMIVKSLVGNLLVFQGVPSFFPVTFACSNS